jgi:hypothetical protein
LPRKTLATHIYISYFACGVEGPSPLTLRPFAVAYSVCTGFRCCLKSKLKEAKMTETNRQSCQVAQWRLQADTENPAGPLFAGGAYAEADIVCETGTGSGHCGTVCTGSVHLYCC